MNFAKLILLLIVFLFISCAKRYENIVLYDFKNKCYIVSELSSVIYVSSSNNKYYFAMFDALGVPVSNKTFYKNHFKNNKFLLNKYDEIFYQILIMINKNINISQYKNNTIRTCQ